MFARLAVSVATSLCALAANATIVNLSADPSHPNASKTSGGFAYNPVTLTLEAGTYEVGVVGIAGGGLYDAWSVRQTSPIGAFTDGWHYSIGDGADNRVVTGVNYDSASAALAAYEALGLTTITLASTESINFYLNDSGKPYFADDAGGVSLSVISVPEPSSLALLAAGLAGLALLGRRRKGA